jgi:MFS transporter, PHS family, inorganic phosphate transporter
LTVYRFAPQRYRARMMTAVSLSQPLGQLFAGLVSAFVARQALKLGTLGFDRKMCDDRCMGDYAWRFIIAIGLVPTIIAVVLRLTIPESPRYILDVVDDPRQAAAAAARLYHNPTATSVTVRLEKWRVLKWWKKD